MKLIIVGFVASAVGACEDGIVSQSEYQQAEYLLDQGRYNEAIYLMELKVEHDPTDERARQLLAAGFAGRAGVYLKDFVNVAELVILTFSNSNAKPQDRALSLARRLKGRSTDMAFDEAVDLSIKILQFLHNLELIVTTFDSVPSVETIQNANEVRRALSVLHGPFSEPLTLRPSNHIYRALLRITVLKFDMRKTFTLANPSQCDVSVGEIVKDATVIQSEISLILSDLAESSSDLNVQTQIQEIAGNFENQFESMLLELDPLEASLMLSLYGEVDLNHKDCQ